MKHLGGHIKKYFVLTNTLHVSELTRIITVQNCILIYAPNEKNFVSYFLKEGFLNVREEAY